MDLFDTKKVKVAFNYVAAVKEIGSALNAVLYPNNEQVQQLLKNVATTFDIRFHEDARFIVATTANVNAINGLEDTASPIIMNAMPVIVQNLKTMTNEIDTFLKKSRTNNFALKMAALAKEKAEFDRSMKELTEEAIEDHKNAVKKLMVVFPPKTDSPTLERKENNTKEITSNKDNNSNEGDDDEIELSPSFEFEKERPLTNPSKSSSLSLSDFSTSTITNPDIGSSSLPPSSSTSSSLESSSPSSTEISSSSISASLTSGASVESGN